MDYDSAHFIPLLMVAINVSACIWWTRRTASTAIHVNIVALLTQSDTSHWYKYLSTYYLYHVCWSVRPFNFAYSRAAFTPQQPLRYCDVRIQGTNARHIRAPCTQRYCWSCTVHLFMLMSHAQLSKGIGSYLPRPAQGPARSTSALIWDTFPVTDIQTRTILSNLKYLIPASWSKPPANEMSKFSPQSYALFRSKQDCYWEQWVLLHLSQTRFSPCIKAAVKLSLVTSRICHFGKPPSFMAIGQPSVDRSFLRMFVIDGCRFLPYATFKFKPSTLVQNNGADLEDKL